MISTVNDIFVVYRYRLISFIVAIISIVFYKSILLFVLGIFFNDYYWFKADCGYKDGRCVTVTYRTKASLSSWVKTYFYIGDGFHIPLFDKNYVAFDDGVNFCFRHVGNGMYNIYSNDPPYENNISDKVTVYKFDLADEECRKERY